MPTMDDRPQTMNNGPQATVTEGGQQITYIRFDKYATIKFYGI